MPDNNQETRKVTLALPVSLINELERRSALRNLNHHPDALDLPGVDRWRSTRWQDVLRGGLAQWVTETAPLWREKAPVKRRRRK